MITDLELRMSKAIKEHYERMNKFVRQRKRYLKEVAMAKTRFDKTKDFKHELIKFFERNKKSSWGKNQIVKVIKDLWIKHLEILMEERKEDSKND